MKKLLFFLFAFVAAAQAQTCVTGSFATTPNLLLPLPAYNQCNWASQGYNVGEARIDALFPGGILAKASGGNGTANPVLIAGTNITITGSWGSYTINSSGGVSAGTPHNPAIYTGSTTVSSSPSSFDATTYSGSTVDVKINACLADALAAHSTCDARGLTNAVASGPLITAAQITVGDSSGDPVTLLLPTEFYWAGGMTDGTSCTLAQYPNTSIVGLGAYANPTQIFGASNTSNLGYVYCTKPIAGNNAPDYWYDFGFMIWNHIGGFFTGHATATGITALITGPVYDQSTWDHVSMFSDVDTYVLQLYNVCCSTNFNAVNINGNYGSIPLNLVADSSGSIAAVNFTNSSIVHNPTNSPLIVATDTGFHVSSVNFDNIYSEVRPVSGGLIQLNAMGSVSIRNFTFKATTSSMTSPAIDSSNTVHTFINANNLIFTNGSGSWTQPCTQAIIDNFLGQTIPCQSISGLGNVPHWDSGATYNGNRFQGGAGLGTGLLNLAIGNATTMHSASFTGQEDTAFGAGAFTALTTGNNNSTFGENSLSSLTTGGGDTAIGVNSGGASVATTANSTFLGTLSTCSVDGLTNSTAVGYQASCNASNQAVIGNSSVADVYFGSTTAAAKTHAAQAFVQDPSFGSNTVTATSACETAYAATTLTTAFAGGNTGLNCLPANSVIDAVVYRITTTITTATSFTIGDSTTAARFCGTQSVMTAGTTGICFAQADQTGAPGPIQAAAAALKYTMNTTPGAGAIRFIVYYHTWTAPTS